MTCQAPFVQGSGMAGSTVIRVGPDRDDIRWVTCLYLTVAGLAGYTFGRVGIRRSLVIGCVAQQAVAWISHAGPTALENRVVESVRMGAV